MAILPRLHGYSLLVPYSLRVPADPSQQSQKKVKKLCTFRKTVLYLFGAAETAQEKGFIYIMPFLQNVLLQVFFKKDLH